jgi:3-keto-disaccharide hydrolase
MKKRLLAPLFLSSLVVGAQEKMMPLFNGDNLNGWYSFLRTKGRNNDPEKVFVVENGLLHISGKEFGYIATEKTFKDFHLVAEFKWGEKKYPPRDADTTKRDNGILYYMPAAVKDTVWPRSIECQVQEGDVGDFWLIDSTTLIIDGKRVAPKINQRVIKKQDAERPHGEWNRVEVISNKGKITHIVNGVIVNEGQDPNVTEGRIVIQSEGAEIYYRKLDIAELK